MNLKECKIEGMPYFYGTKSDLFEVCQEKILETIGEYILVPQ